MDHDLSWRSRKLVFSAGIAVLVFLAAVLGAAWATFSPQLVGMTQDSLLMVLAGYLGVNLGSRMNVASVVKAAVLPGSTPGKTTPPTPASPPTSSGPSASHG